MSVQYYEPIMDKIEKEEYKSFVGYINPREQLIDYSTLIGYQSHCTNRNPASHMYLRFISFLVKGYSPDKLKYFWDEEQILYKDNKTEGYDYVVKRGYDYFHRHNVYSYESFLSELNTCYNERQEIIKEQINSQESFWKMHVYENLINDIISFFKQAYSNGDFFKAIGRILQVQCFDNFEKIHKKEMDEQDRLHEKYPYMGNGRDFYEDYVIFELMSYFKDIMVQYLGYDSIERRIKLNPNKDNIFKVITTSCTNPNERFYNWLLMDWNIHRIPKMYWNEEEKRFIKENSISNYYQTEKEDVLGKEIGAIKREVPKQYRKEFFRR